MKSRSFIILLIVLIVIGSGTMYSCVLVGDPHDKFHKIKRELYVRGNTASVNLELDKGNMFLIGAGRVILGKPVDSKKPFIVSVKKEEDIVRANKTGARIALIIGILIAVAGILVMIFMR